MILPASLTGYRFDNIFIDLQNRRLLRDDLPVSLNSKYFDVLVLLVSRSGQLMEKRRIFEEAWPGIIVSDASLTQCVKEIRRQLQDDAIRPRYIKTVPKHGYMFIAPVQEIREPEENSPEPVSLSVTVPPSLSVVARPYKFLDYYTEQDAGLFFGREDEIVVVRSQILSHRSFLLYGRSGVGKSSMLRAGLIPRLQTEGYDVVVVRSFTDPLPQLSQILFPDGNHPENGGSGIEKTEPHKPVIVMLDQFEEFFTRLNEKTQETFIKTVGRLTALPPPFPRFVFVLREDMLAEMSRFKPALPEIFHHEYRLNRLSRSQAACAIVEPARMVGCTLDERLVERLVDDLSDQNDVDPPHLQIVCDALYDARNTDNHIAEEAYDRLGGAGEILAEYLLRVLRRFNASDLTRVQQILLALISEDGQRLVLREVDLDKQAYGNGEDTLAALAEELVAARVVRRRSQNGERWLELAHECLIPEISGWLTSSVYAHKQAQSLLDRAVQNYRVHRLILDPDSLDLLYPFLDELGVSDEEADLLTLSLLHRGRSVPEWLTRRAPSAAAAILESTAHTDAGVRLCAITSSRPIRGPELNRRLRTLALWDGDLNIRRAANIELADWFGSAVEAVLARAPGDERPGRIRQAVSLAIVREYNTRLIRLPHLSLAVSVMVMIGLLLVRLRHSGVEIIRQGTGGAFGGAASGLIGGLMLATGLSLARYPEVSEIGALFFVLASLGAFVGAFGGAGVSFGMSAPGQLGLRPAGWWGIAGASTGGALVGACANLFSVDVLKTLFGQHPEGLTGGLEGSLIGAGVALGPVVAHRLTPAFDPWQRPLRVLIGALGGMAAGIALTVVGGNLFSSSLEIVQKLFADSQIRFEPIALLFGEGYFGRTTKIALGALEGFLFGGGVTTGIEMFINKTEPSEKLAR